jgi:cell division protein FtsW
MLTIKRGNTFFHRWWWTVDVVMLFLLFTLFIVGILLATTASPAVAERLGVHSFYFANRQFIFLFLSTVLVVGISMLSEKQIKLMSFAGFACFLVLMVLVLFLGDETKGAKRWMNIGSFSLQPSEFIKPFYVVVMAMILSSNITKAEAKAPRKSHEAAKQGADMNVKPHHTLILIALGIHSIVAALLLLEPDFGMTISISAVFAGQLFLAGLPMLYVILLATLLVGGGTAAYFTLPHVARRVDNFLSSDISENYQVERSLEAYSHGGLFGVGPGEGTVKAVLPDSHTDFIFAVAGEEFGGLLCSLIILLFALITLRGFIKAFQQSKIFNIYAISGLLMHFAIQSIFNIGVTLHLFPTKGMTLPFISCGGSSVLSFGIIFGMCLALSRKQYGSSVSNNAHIKLRKIYVK